MSYMPFIFVSLRQTYVLSVVMKTAKFLRLSAETLWPTWGMQD